MLPYINFWRQMSVGKRNEMVLHLEKTNCIEKNLRNGKKKRKTALINDNIIIRKKLI